MADDGICPKASVNSSPDVGGKDTGLGGPLLSFSVYNTTVRSHSHAIKFGSNTDALMKA